MQINALWFMAYMVIKAHSPQQDTLGLHRGAVHSIRT
jgi:hypothetical protein